MTDLLERPPREQVTQAQERRQRARPGRLRQRPSHGLADTASVAALVLAAILPLRRVFVTADWVWPVVLAALLPVALSWVLRRLRVPWWGALPAMVIAWMWYTATLLPNTLRGGVLPTMSTLRIAVIAATQAIQNIPLLPAPVYPEIPLLLLAVTGVWWVSASIDLLALRMASPGKAILCAMTLWVVPLAIVPDGAAPWLLAAPLLLASVLVLLAEADRDIVRWGAVVVPGAAGRRSTSRQPSGMILAICAVLVGALVAGLLPGFGDPPWYQLRAQATTTLTDNPIVQLRTNLVAQDTGPILRVRSAQPIYLRSTALDHYSETEEWTASDSGIQLQPLRRGFVPGANFTADRRQVRIEVVNLTDADLVPAPANAVQFEAPEGVRPLYDPNTSTFVFENAKLQTGHRYQVVASGPQMNPEVAASLDTPADPQLTQLPDGVPEEVGRLAREIVDRAGATTPFTQALAIQNELRTWEYSLEPPAGHSGVAMRTFLEQRVGYCEQFAGTMAVMLRTLGIPARVAVGFTPGTVSPDDPTLWTVTWANAHAWVEVKFGGQWLAFEPTPRSDGNVLVPTASDLTPTQTAQAPTTTLRVPAAQPQDARFDIFAEREALANQAQRPPELQQGIGGGGVGGPSRLLNPTLVFWITMIGLLAVAGLMAVGRREGNDASPRARILSVRERVGRLGHGIGLPPPAWETDSEYLLRLGGDSPAAHALADAATRARYAATVPAALAERAEAAGAELSRALLADRPPWQRLLVRWRGDLSAGWSRLRRVGQRSSSSRRRRSWK